MVGLILLIAAVIFVVIALKAVSGIIGWLIAIGIWMLIGYAAGQLIRGKDYGPVGNVALGLGGGIVGSIVLGIIGLSFGNVWIISQVIVGVIGATLLIFGMRLFADENFGR